MRRKQLARLRAEPFFDAFALYLNCISTRQSCPLPMPRACATPMHCHYTLAPVLLLGASYLPWVLSVEYRSVLQPRRRPLALVSSHVEKRAAVSIPFICFSGLHFSHFLVFHCSILQTNDAFFFPKLNLSAQNGSLMPIYSVDLCPTGDKLATASEGAVRKFPACPRAQVFNLARRHQVVVNGGCAVA